MNTFLETAISLVLVILLFSIITYVIQELISINLRFRSKMLWKSICQLLDGATMKGRMKLWKKENKLASDASAASANLTTEFYNHPQIKSQQKDLSKMPMYIPAANFALAVMDMIAKKASAAKGNLFEDVQAGLKTFASSKGSLITVIQNLVSTSKNIEELQKKIEEWFNEYMKRVTGWYESHITITLRFIALAVVIFFNLNLIKMAKTIYKDGQLRGSLVAMAERITDNPELIAPFLNKEFDKKVADTDSIYKVKLASAASAQDSAALLRQKSADLDSMAKSFTAQRRMQIDSLVTELKVTKLPLGWTNDWKKDFQSDGKNSGALNTFFVIIGWLIAAGCISMGAPFWFDMLAKLVNVRRSGLKPK